MRPALSLLLPLALLLAAPPAPAQQPPAAIPFVNSPVGLTPAQAASFKAALDALAQQGHVCLIAEDAPLHPTLAPKDAPAVPGHTPLDAAVKLVADAYDYDAARTGGVFVLTKRYSDPADLPDVTLEECAEDLNNAALAFEAFDPPEDLVGGPGVDSARDQIAAVLGGLTPDQLRAVFSRQGVPVSELGGGAQEALDKWGLGMHLDGPTSITRRYQADIARAGRASVGMVTTRQADGSALTLFGRRVPNSRGGTSLMAFDETIPATGDRDPSGGPVTPDEADAARAWATRRKADGRETLAQAAAALAGRGLRCEVSPALAAKAVTAAGEAGAAPDAVLAGLAGAYGLRVRHRQSDDTEVLDLPERRSPVSVAAVRGDVLALLPAPLLRACFHLADANAPLPAGQAAQIRQRIAALSALPPGPLSASQRHELIYAPLELADPSFARRHAVFAVHRAAVRALRVAAGLYPASAREGDEARGLVPVAALTPEDRSTYSTALMTLFMSDMMGLRNASPYKPLSEGGYALTARVYAKPDVRGTWKVDLTVNRPGPGGTLRMAGGMSDVEYDGPPPPEAAPSVAATPPTP